VRILITGSNGQLGTELLRCLELMWSEIGPIPEEYRGACVDAAGVAALDIADAAAVDRWFSQKQYDLVFNCAAMTNVDGCETAEEAAYAVNAVGVENLAKASAAQGAKLVHVSTDYVFAGDTPGERVESDQTRPVSAYGRTKLAGEKLALAANPKTFVCRTAWLYGYAGQNFVKTMRRIGQSLSSVNVVDDQFGNPTSANDLAHELLKLALTDDYGIYHITNKGTCSWAEFAKVIMAGLGLPCIVKPVTSVEYKAANPESADRPHFSSLRNRRLEETIGDEMRPWRDALGSYLKALPELEG